MGEHNRSARHFVSTTTAAIASFRGELASAYLACTPVLKRQGYRRIGGAGDPGASGWQVSRVWLSSTTDSSLRERVEGK
jgi:hypothetical protein